jgi:hypothetical protein
MSLLTRDWICSNRSATTGLPAPVARNNSTDILQKRISVPNNAATDSTIYVQIDDQKQNQ